MRALHEIGVELSRTTVATVPVGTARTGEALQLLNEVAEVIDATTLKEELSRSTITGCSCGARAVRVTPFLGAQSAPPCWAAPLSAPDERNGEYHDVFGGGL